MNAPRAATTSAQAERAMLVAERFVTLADTLVNDYDVVDLLHRLTNASVELLDVTEAGLMLTDPQGRLQIMASSSEATRVLELFELQSREGGPCVEAVKSGQPVSVEDFGAVTPWPRFADAALRSGFKSMHAVPMRLRENTIGAMNLFNREAPPLDTAEQRIARALTDVATIAILQQRSADRTTIVNEQLQAALNTRIVIEQAKGVLAESGQVTMDVAFNAMRRYSRDHSTKLSETAHALVHKSLPPAEVFGL